jgi:hypothetical protein
MPKRKQRLLPSMTRQEIWERPRLSKIGRRAELYGSAYKLAWEQIPPAERRARPDLPLRVYASIRRHVKEGAIDARTIAFTALKDALAV